MPAKLWLFDPKFWNCLPKCLRSDSASQSPTMSANQCILDLHEAYTHVHTHLYRPGALEIEVCPFYFESKAGFFEPFFAYLKEVLFDNGHVYLSVFTQPYLRVEENTDFISMYNRLVDFLESECPTALSRLHYHHLADYGTATEDHQTLVWKLDTGTKHNQDEALLREVCRFPGNSPTFGCGCYAAYPGTLFSVSRAQYGPDYAGLHAFVLQEIARRGGQDEILKQGDIRLNDLEFPLNESESLI